MKQEDVIFLNGTSSSGKTTIGHHPSTTDGFLWVFPHGDTHVSEIRVGPAALRLCADMYGAAAALATTGNDVIIDDVVVDSRVLEAAVTSLHPFNVLFVGVRCPMDVAEGRARARGDRFQGLVNAHYTLVHAHGRYDLDIDTSMLTPMECATHIKERLQNGPAPNALQRLRHSLGNR
jgi:chloramphenicol 3-O phosphotransferase